MIRPKIRVVISNMAWIYKPHLTDVEVFQYKKSLSVIPKVMNTNDGAQSIEMYRETKNYIGVPRAYFRQEFTEDTDRYDITYDVCEGRKLPFNEFKIKLREDQQHFVDVFLGSLMVGNWGCGIGEAYTGFGKSVVGIILAENLKVNTLIIVHNEEIRNVWAETIHKFYPNATVGLIQGDECDYKKDFVIGMCQSLMNDEGKYPEEIYRTFGLVFVDEVHRFGSRAFGSVAPRFNSRYIFGFSGTVRRQDDCECVFTWTIGNIVVFAEQTNRVLPIVWFRDTKTSSPKKAVPYKNVKGEQVLHYKYESTSKWSRPRLLKFLSTDQQRLRLIAQDVILVLKKFRNPLLVSERKEPLLQISKLIADLVAGDPFFKTTVTHGFYFGGADDKVNARLRLDAASRCTVVYATLQKAKEGVDIVRLDTLHLITPNTDTEQVCGRICRPTVKLVDGEMVNQKRMQPIVFDYVDCLIPACRSSFQQRLGLYQRLNWQIKDLDKLDFGD